MTPRQGVYVLKAQTGTRYVGISCNLQQRLYRHGNAWELEEFVEEHDQNERLYIESEKIGVLSDSGVPLANTYKTDKRRR